jgi:hypothetical protein
MAMQTDVKATAPLTATGTFQTPGSVNMAFRARIKAIYAICGSSAGSVVIRDGSDTGPILLTLNTPVSSGVGNVYLLLPGEGILAENGLHGTVTNTSSITVFYG